MGWHRSSAIHPSKTPSAVKGRVLQSIFSQFPLPFLFSQYVTISFLLCLVKSAVKSKISVALRHTFQHLWWLSDTRSALPSLQTSSWCTWLYLSSRITLQTLWYDLSTLILRINWSKASSTVFSSNVKLCYRPQGMTPTILHDNFTHFSIQLLYVGKWSCLGPHEIR